MEPDDGLEDSVNDAKLLVALKMAQSLLKNGDIQEALNADADADRPQDKLNQYQADGVTLKKGTKDNRKILERQITDNESACFNVMNALEDFVEQKIYEILRIERILDAHSGDT